METFTVWNIDVETAYFVGYLSPLKEYNNKLGERGSAFGRQDWALGEQQF